MLIIRREQMHALKGIMRRNFEDELLVALRKYFPADYEELGEVQMRRVIDLGIARAARHAFESRGHVRDYVCLMFLFGSYFDEDPLVPWASQMLTSEDCGGPFGVMETLYAGAKDYLKRISGDHGEHYTRALQRARLLSFKYLGEPQADPIWGIKFHLETIYPERYRALTESDLKRFTDMGEDLARQHGLTSPEDILVYILLMFMIGSHFDRDPLHPWAAAALQGSREHGPEMTARKLYDAAMARLGRAMNIDRQKGGH